MSHAMSQAEKQTLRRLLASIDLTSLNDAHDDDIAVLCQKALTPFGPVAAVCSWTEFTADMTKRLAGESPAVAAVINFPYGDSDSKAAADEARDAVAAGANELDLVWPYRAWLAGEKNTACAVIAAVKAVAGAAKLKVILETGALGKADIVARASADAIAAGADVLKTSTGKIAQGASLEAAEAMLGAIRASGKDVGFKASGGIRTVAEATAYLNLAERIMGPGWATPAHFRIGASRLLDDLLSSLNDDPHEDTES